ncbi:N-acetylglucosamine-6-phosphate deacetylase [Enterococcus casseliflavus]|nr:N-acetylglucosamine-6-phosphate deacetylase [Enterococcus casseliflavus]
MTTNIIDGTHYRTKDYLKVFVTDGYISKIEVLNDLKKEQKSDRIIAPGFTDIQINGYFGFDFNSEELTEEDVLTVTKILKEKGTTCYCPTLITNSPVVISKQIKKIVAAVRKYEECEKAIVGIHLEGPFLSGEDGPRGAHPIEFIREPNINLLRQWVEESEGLVKIVTLAPELENSEELIRYCKANNIICSIGHTSAKEEDVKKAVYNGASLSTHLGNGSHTRLPRHDNYIYNQLASDYLTASFIADGVHLPFDVLKNFLKIKKDKAVLISDSSEIAGLKPGEYTTHIGGKVVLTEDNRLCTAQDHKILAGSAVALIDEINFLYDKEILPLSESIYMASEKPAELLGLTNKIAVGEKVNLLILKNEKGIHVVDTVF